MIFFKVFIFQHNPTILYILRGDTAASTSTFPIFGREKRSPIESYFDVGLVHSPDRCRNRSRIMLNSRVLPGTLGADPEGFNSSQDGPVAMSVPRS